jgi:hypothetical protein
MAKGWTLRPGPGQAQFFSFCPSDSLADDLGYLLWRIAIAGQAQFFFFHPSDRLADDLGYLLGRIAVYSLVVCLCRFRRGMSQLPSRGRQTSDRSGTIWSVEQATQGRADWVSPGRCYLRQTRALDGEQAPQRWRISPRHVAVAGAFWSRKKSTGMYK